MLVPDSGRDGAGVLVPRAIVGVLVGPDVAHKQFAEFKQLGFLQTLPEQTMLFAQSELLLQLSPQERGVVGVAVGVAEAQRQLVELSQLGFLHSPSSVHIIPFEQSVSSVQSLPQEGGTVGVGLGDVDGLELGELVGLPLGVGDELAVSSKLTRQAFPAEQLPTPLLMVHLQSAA